MLFLLFLYLIFITQIFAASIGNHSKLSPSDIEPGWLTLATGASTSSPQHGREAHSSQTPPEVHRSRAHHEIQNYDLLHQVQTRTNRINNQANQNSRTKEAEAKKIRQSRKAVWTTEKRLEQSKLLQDYRKKNPFTLETRMKISKAVTGRQFSQTAINNMSKAKMGKPRSQATKDKIRKTVLNKLVAQKADQQQHQ